MKALFLAALLAPSVVVAAERHEWLRYGQMAWVEIGEPQAPGAVATITFANRSVHNGDETFEIDWNGINVVIDLEWDYRPASRGNSEVLTITPPTGYIAVPHNLEVGEDATGVAHIYSNGVGM